MMDYFSVTEFFYCLLFLSLFLSTVLMCRGKAVKDFKGPDCRFVDFKEGESIYVYYKLIGRTNELWAGSVSFLSVFTNIGEHDI